MLFRSITRDTFDKAAVFTDVVAQESINPPTEKETTKPVNGPDGDGWLWNLENYEWTKEGFSIKQGGDRFWVRTAWTDKGMACTESRPTLKEAKEFGDRMIEQRKKTDSVKPIEPCDGWVQQKRSDVVEWTKEGISIKYEDGKFWVRSPHDMSQVGIARIESRPILAEAKLLGDTIIEHWKKIEERKKSDPVKPPDAHTNEGWRSFFPDSDMWVNNKLHIKRLSPSKFFLSSYESDVIYHYEPMTFATLKEAKTEGDYWLKHGERSLPPGFEPIIPPPPPNTFDVDELIRHLKNEKPPGPFASLILLESVIYLLERERARILQGG